MQLTPEQASLYAATVADMLSRIEDAADDISRRGLVLATLAKLKQVCNHPAHLLGDGSRARPYQVRIGVLPLTTAQWRRVSPRWPRAPCSGPSCWQARCRTRSRRCSAAAARRCFPGWPATWTCGAAVRTGKCRASIWRRSATCWPRSSTAIRSPCWPGAARAATSCSRRYGRYGPAGAARLRARRRSAARRRRRRRRCRAAEASAPPRPAAPALPLPESAEEFWSARLSPGRLRALAASSGPAAPDLLLRMFPPPPVKVRGQDLADVLAPAYRWLAEADPGE